MRKMHKLTSEIKKIYKFSDKDAISMAKRWIRKYGEYVTSRECTFCGVPGIELEFDGAVIWREITFF